MSVFWDLEDGGEDLTNRCSEQAEGLVRGAGRRNRAARRRRLFVVLNREERRGSRLQPRVSVSSPLLTVESEVGEKNVAASATK